mmetsp:Transcript_69279/g.223893  ORF Transcript_69279/g.223893 Transcript_69279/m.223893 type:complete len:214 (+) Transcript_69279:622-1263(+)
MGHPASPSVFMTHDCKCGPSPSGAVPLFGAARPTTGAAMAPPKTPGAPVSSLPCTQTVQPDGFSRTQTWGWSTKICGSSRPAGLGGISATASVPRSMVSARPCRAASTALSKNVSERRTSSNACTKPRMSANRSEPVLFRIEAKSMELSAADRDMALMDAGSDANSSTDDDAAVSSWSLLATSRRVSLNARGMVIPCPVTAGKTHSIPSDPNG